MTITSQQLRELAGKATQDCPNVMHLPLPMHMVEALLTALELQERLDKPETVEVVARAIRDAAYGCDWEEWIDEAKGAINALKGGAQ